MHPIPNEPEAPVILVLDDDPGIRALLRHLLERAGYTVETAADGAAGLARIAAGDIDLLLLDQVLPDWDGLELCQQVRAQQDAVYLPIIVLTGVVGDAQRHAGFVAGADDYVTKPFKITDLLDRLQVWVRTRQRLKEAHARRQQLERERTERAQLEGVLLAARTMEHELNNALTPTVGYMGLLAHDPRLPPHLCAAAQAALEGATEAARLLQQFHQITSVQEQQWGTVGPTIDLVRSASGVGKAS